MFNERASCIIFLFQKSGIRFSGGKRIKEISKEILVSRKNWIVNWIPVLDHAMNMIVRHVERKTNFRREILGGMEIGHGSDLPVTAGSVPADLRLSSKGLFFMFELNCPKQRALSTLAEVMIAILKRELADVSTNFQPRYYLLPPLFCFYALLSLSLFPFSFRFPFSIILLFPLPPRSFQLSSTRRNIRNHRLTSTAITTRITTGAAIQY